MVKIIFLIALFLSTAIALPYHIERSNDNLMPISRSLKAEAIPNEYIVVFKKKLTAKQISDHYDNLDKMLNDENKLKTRAEDSPYGVSGKYEIGKFRGYAGTFSKDCVKKIEKSSDVAYVETNKKVFATAFVSQKNAEPNLVRISHKDVTGKNSYDFDEIAGKGVNLYVLDTGIRITHKELGGRAKVGAIIPSGASNTDKNGHGTHVAVISAGKTFGVAKNANVFAVKVLGDDGSGSNADVIKGIQFVEGDHQKNVNNAGFKGSVINMSLGGGKSQAVDDAVGEVFDKGVVVVVAAGNEAVDACTESPSGAPKAIAIGSIDDQDTLSVFSNFGKCVKLFAPGENIVSAGINSDTDTATLTGTSQASPHAAGLAAYFLSLSDTLLTPDQLRGQLLSVATPGAVKNATGSSNLLAFNDNPNP